VAKASGEGKINRSKMAAPDKYFRGQAPAGIQVVCICLKILDSRFHGNDKNGPKLTFYETIKNGYMVCNYEK
jgi:hypothetical protein